MTNKKTKHIMAVILGLFIVAYNWIWFNKTFTLSEGWAEFYVELMNRGKVPYRDFYYFLPPLSLFEDWVIWKLSFGYFIVYRSWRLLQRVFMAEFVYYVISKRVHPIVAFLGGILSTILLSANVYDLCGDYNQTQQFLVILMGFVLLKYVDAVKNESSKKYLWTTIAGAIGGLMFLQKQTVVLASFIVFGLLFIFLIIIKFEKSWLKSLISIAMGALIPILPVGLYLAVNKAFGDFIYQVYQDTSSKGGLIEIAFGKLGKVLGDNVLFILMVVGLTVAMRFLATENRKKIAYGLLAIVCCLTGVFVKPFFDDLSNTISNIGFDANHGFIKSVYNNGLLFGHMTKIMTVIFLGVFVWIIYHVIDCKVENKEHDFHALVLAFTSTAAGYSTIMANGETFVSVITAFIIIPTAVYLMFRDKQDIKQLRVPNICISVFVLLIFVICISQKFVCAYAWWGDTEASYWEKTETVNIKSLKGYKFSKEEKYKFEKLNELIDYYTDDESVIWGFPYTKVYNLFQQNYNMNGFVPVEFYDVCADDFAKKEAKLLAENEPDIVIWTDIPGCIEVHEVVYRNGNPLGQRAIQKWFSDVKDSDYTLVGQVGNIFVYKLNNEVAVDYTFITRKTAKNETSYYPEKVSFVEDSKLEGKGTVKRPYLIQSIEDFEYFRDQVNAGNSFDGNYFKQTCDIQLDSSVSWEAIGNSEENPFAGIYDGNGYSISGLYMLSDNDEDLALFGWITGTIANLSVKNAWIGGQYVACIACNGNGRVINCYASGILYGYGGGGIAYCINGPIVNCVGMVTVEKGMASGISGFCTNDVQNCFSNMADGIDIDSGDPIDANTAKLLNEYVKEYNKKNKDVKLLEWDLDKNGLYLVKEE